MTLLLLVAIMEVYFILAIGHTWFRWSVPAAIEQTPSLVFQGIALCAWEIWEHGRKGR